jgi:hypothetical protein
MSLRLRRKLFCLIWFLSCFASSYGAENKPAFVHIMPSQSGITWVHSAGRSPERYLPESSGAGCAFFDYNNDGWMDIYLVNSGKSEFFNPDPPLRNALYRNNRDGTFTDVTEKAGVTGTGYGMGVTVGDFDNDGNADLYVTQYGNNVLYRNNGDGTFTDVTSKAGVAASGWSSSAAWFDYDNDGRPDLFVGQFAHLDLATGCGVSADGRRHYCIPTIFEPRKSWLFHNQGDGTFRDVSKESGIGIPPGKVWGVVATDIDNDGWVDLFVSNDTVPNFLFRNKGNGKFEDIAMVADVAYSSEGKARSGMGVDSADYNEDGWMDLFVGNIDQEIFSLYRNNRDRSFSDQAMQHDIGMATRWMSGWGLKLFDYDNDGDLDLLNANGFPDDFVDELGTEVTYKQPMKLFENALGVFRDVSAANGTVFKQSFAARGLAIGDYDNDGGVDALVLENDGPPVLLRNQAAAGSHWLGLKLVGTKSNRDAVGARLTYKFGDQKRYRMNVGGGSFLSSSDPRVVLGLGNRKLESLEVKWPNGTFNVFRGLPADKYITLMEGTNKWK